MQSIPNTANDYSATFYELDGVNYLAIAGAGAAPEYVATSQIYVFNGSTSKFEPYQDITTPWCAKWFYYELDGDSYLAGWCSVG